MSQESAVPGRVPASTRAVPANPVLTPESIAGWIPCQDLAISVRLSPCDAVGSASGAGIAAMVPASWPSPGRFCWPPTLEVRVFPIAPGRLFIRRLAALDGAIMGECTLLTWSSWLAGWCSGATG
jgi:hypothetical protein